MTAGQTGEAGPADAWRSFAQHRAYLVGIDAYRNGISPLQTAAADARRLAELLRERHRFDVHPPLIDAQASAAGLRELLATMRGELGDDDRALFYFAGHGVAADGDDGPAGFLVPADAHPAGTATLLPMAEVLQALQALRCRHLLVILDCCFSGAFRWASTQRGVVVVPKRIYQQRFARFVADRAWQVITSAACDQKALDVLDRRALGDRGISADASGLHSPFAQRLFQALEGAADACQPGEPHGDGIITATELYLYLRNTVEVDSQAQDPRQRQTPSFFPLGRHDKGEFIFLHPRHALNLPRMEVTDSPYKGLQSFDIDDAHLFYGRERVVTPLLERARDDSRRLLVVTGASGSGKSSLVKAGLLPVLQKTRPDLRVLEPLRPGDDPLAALQAALAKAKANAVLVIDQLEEVITRRRGPVAQALQDFDEALARLLQPGSPVAKVIVTVRSDFEPQFSAGAQLGPLWAEARFPVPPFDIAELRQVVQMPAVQAAMDFQPARLVDDIVNEVAQSPGALPLLSYALSEMFHAYLARMNRGEADRTLKEADYKAMGGAIGAMTRKAERLYDDMKDRASQDAMRRILLRMVSVEGELAGRRVAVEALPVSAADDTVVRDVVEMLVSSRLVVRTREGQADFIEPAHDALVRAWARLTGWVDEMGRDRLTLAARLAAAAAEEAAGQRRSGLLWNANPNLATVENWLKPSPAPEANWLNLREKDFIRRSVALKKRNTRVAIGITAAVVVVLALITVFAVSERQAAVVAARKANARALAATAETQLASSPDRAALLAIEALSLEDFSQARAVILRAYRDADYRLSLRREAPAAATDTEIGLTGAQISADGQTVLTEASDNVGVRLWDGGTGSPRPLVPLPGLAALPGRHGQLSPDGRWMLTTAGEGQFDLWNATTGKQLRRLEGDEPVFSPDSQSILAKGNSGEAIVWETQTGRLLKRLTSKPDPISWAAWAGPANRILSVSAQGRCLLWPLDKSAPVPAGRTGMQHGDEAPELGLRLSGDGRRLLVTENPDDEGVIAPKVLDLVTGVLTSGPQPAAGAAARKAFGEDAWLASAGLYVRIESERTAKETRNDAWLYRLPGAAPVKLEGQEGRVGSPTFSPDGRVLATRGGEAGNVHLRSPQTGKTFAVLGGHVGGVRDLRFSNDGSRLVTAGQDGTARLWRSDGILLRTLRGHEGPLRTAFFSPDGKTVLTVGQYDAVRLWDSTPPVETARLRLQHQAIKPLMRFALSGEARSLAIADGRSIRLFDLTPPGDGPDAGTPRRAMGRFETKPPSVAGLAFSVDGRFLLATADDGTRQAWSVATGQASPPAPAPAAASAPASPARSNLHVVGLASDGMAITTEGADGRRVTWSGADAEDLVRRRRIQFSQDRKTMLVPSFFSEPARLFQAGGARPPVTLGSGSFWLAPDGQRVVQIEVNGQRRLLSAADGRELYRLGTHAFAAYEQLSFVRHGELLMLVRKDTIEVFDLATGLLLRQMPADPGATWEVAGLTVDSRSVVALQSDLTVRWLACPECQPLPQVVGELQKRIGRGLTAQERDAFGLPVTAGQESGL